MTAWNAKRNVSVLLAAIVLLAAGCFKSDTTVTVNPDGSGAVSMTVLISTEMISEMSASFSTGEEPETTVVTACEEASSDGVGDVPDTVTVELIDNDEWCGVHASWSFAAGEQPFAVLNEDPAAEDDELLSMLSHAALRRLDDGWLFEADNAPLAESRENTSDETAMIDAAFAQFLNAEVSFSIDLPGEVVSHNAHEVDGSLYTWRFDQPNPNERLFVETRETAGATVALPLALGVGGAGALFAAAVALRRQFRASRAVMPGATVSNTIDADTPRRTRDSVIVTGAILLLLIGAPLQLFARLLAVRAAVDAGAAPLSALAPTDAIWVGLMVLWVLVAHQLLRRAALPKDTRLFPHQAQSAMRQMVELSLFGAGPLLGWTTANPDVGLDWLESPATSAEAGSGSSSPTAVSPKTETNGSTIATPTALPAVTAPPVRTNDYVVERGDTFWSLAEATYGDGRHWQKIRELNLGREVAPGVVMDERSDLSTGWAIVLPVVRKKEADHED